MQLLPGKIDVMAHCGMRTIGDMLFCSAGEMDRLRKFWLTGACKKPAYGKGRESSHPLNIINFTSAYILLMVGIGLSSMIILCEHCYFKFCRRRLRKADRCGCCSLLSLVRPDRPSSLLSCDTRRKFVI